MSSYQRSNPEYGDYTHFVYGLVRQMKPKTILEVGLGPHGHTAGAILAAIGENEAEHEQKAKYYVIDFNPTNEALEVLKSFPKERFELREGDSANSKLFTGFAGETAVNLFLVDGNHTTQYAYNDTANLLVNNGFDPINGLIVFHDAQMHTVRIAIEKLKEHFNLEVFYFMGLNLAVAKVRH